MTGFADATMFFRVEMKVAELTITEGPYRSNCIQMKHELQFS